MPTPIRNALEVAAGCLLGAVMAVLLLAPYAMLAPRCTDMPPILIGGAILVGGCPR